MKRMSSKWNELMNDGNKQPVMSKNAFRKEETSDGESLWLTLMGIEVAKWSNASLKNLAQVQISPGQNNLKKNV